MTDLVIPKRSRLRPTMPCATCDRLLWWFKGYRLGVTRCLECRATAQVAAQRPCPVCGGPMKTPTAATCLPCANRARGRKKAEAHGGYASRRAKDRLRCARRRAREAQQLVEVVDPDVVYERDRWRCHVCRRRIDRRLSGRAAMGPTLDHLVPLAEGGEHSYANVAAAHRRCNSRRGTRGAAQLALL